MVITKEKEGRKGQSDMMWFKKKKYTHKQTELVSAGFEEEHHVPRNVSGF